MYQKVQLILQCASALSVTYISSASVLYLVYYSEVRN